MSEGIGEFRESQPLTLGVELELQLLSRRDYDLTRGATDLMQALEYDERFGEIKLEITESMIEVSTLPQITVAGIAADLAGLRDTLVTHCRRNNIALCGGGTHAFHRWPERRICPGERFDAIYQRYGYLAKQFTVFGQHIHVGVTSADEAIWLTQALGEYVPVFIALSAASPFVDGVDTLFQSARLNAVSAFPLSGQCPPLADWHDFLDHFRLLQDCGIAKSIKDLYWDVRPKPEFGTVEIRVCDTPLSVGRATALAALAQSLCRYLLRERPGFDAEGLRHVARYNKFQACRYGRDALLSEPALRRQRPLGERINELMILLEGDAAALGCSDWLRQLTDSSRPGDAEWLRATWERVRNINDVVCEASALWMGEGDAS